MLTTFLKLKTPIFPYFETEYTYNFILDYYERLHILGIVQQDGVDFLYFKI